MAKLLSKDLVVVSEDLLFQEIVGSGAYGEVWQGKWRGKGGGITVAIKKIPIGGAVNEQIQKQIISEVDILATLRHPCCLQIFGACFMRQDLCIVMEFMKGGTLYELLHSDISLDWETRWRLAQRATMGVNVLHESDPFVIHRDIKSLNFLVSEDLEVIKLIDFGLSKVATVVSSVPRESIGTTRWGAPETFQYPPKWTPKADIYSLGITFYEIASGKVPFEELDDMRVMYQVSVLKFRPEIPSDCPEEFAQIINECWDDRPENRPTSRQLVEKFEELEAKNFNISFDTLADLSPTDSVENSIELFGIAYRVCWNPHDDCIYTCSTNAIKKISQQGDNDPFASMDSPKDEPTDIVMNYKERTFFVACKDTNKILKISATGKVELFAGSAFGLWGCEDGRGKNACFSFPLCLAIDQRSGNLFVSDQNNHLIRMISPEGEVSTIGGEASDKGYEDGNYKNKTTKFNLPVGICFDESDTSLLVCDKDNNKIRRISLVTSEITTVCQVKQPTLVAIISPTTIMITSDNGIFKATRQGKDYYEASLLPDRAVTPQQAQEEPENYMFHLYAIAKIRSYFDEKQ